MGPSPRERLPPPVRPEEIAALGPRCRVNHTLGPPFSSILSRVAV